MRMRVRSQGDEVFIEFMGIAGRQQQILQALSECQLAARTGEAEGAAPQASDVAVRAGTNNMRIRLKGRVGLRFEATLIYRYLRHALIERPASRSNNALAT